MSSAPPPRTARGTHAGPGVCRSGMPRLPASATSSNYCSTGAPTPTPMCTPPAGPFATPGATRRCVKRLLLARGARRQPYMVAEAHEVEEARRLLAAGSGEEIASELAWSAADNGCPAIVELALARLEWPRDDPRWHWILIQPIRGSGASGNEGHFASMLAILRHGVDPNVARFGQTVLHFCAARQSDLNGPDRARFAACWSTMAHASTRGTTLLRSTPLGWACRWGTPGTGRTPHRPRNSRSMNQTPSRGPPRAPGRSRAKTMTSSASGTIAWIAVPYGITRSPDDAQPP